MHYLLIVLIIIIAAFIIILLLPAILELIKPKDAGPRRIPEKSTTEENEKCSKNK